MLGVVQRAEGATGVPRRTLRRWRAWWRGEFAQSSIWMVMRARFRPPPPELVAQQQTVMAEQQKLIAELQARLAERDERSAALEAQVRRLERELLGPKSEKIKVPPVDRDLGSEEPSEEEQARRREEIAQKRRHYALARRAAVATEEVTHNVAEDSKRCPNCNGTRFGQLGFETSTTFEYVPGRFVRRVHRREKLACACGECILVAPGPPKLVPGGQYGFGFAAFLVVEKCADSIPIYRIEKRFERLGIPLSRATMNDIVHAAAERIEPLVARLTARIAGIEIVLADETSMRLQDRKKRGFIWVFHGRDEQSGGELVLYVFATDRSGDTPVKILGGTGGALIVDGYTGYNVVTDPERRKRGGCWCHLRRKLFEARLAPGDDADIGIDKMRGLFRVEHEATARRIVGSPDHLALRKEKSHSSRPRTRTGAVRRLRRDDPSPRAAGGPSRRAARPPSPSSGGTTGRPSPGTAARQAACTAGSRPAGTGTARPCPASDRLDLAQRGC
jgi:transposase